MTRRIGPCPSSPIAFSEGAEAILLVACQSVEAAEKEGFEGAAVDPYSEEEDNYAFLNQCLSDNESSSKEEHSGNEDEWDDDNEDDNGQASQASWIDSGATVKARNKLIRILKEEALIPQQQWSLQKLLATLLHHRKDPGLRSVFFQFKRFAYRTVFVESSKNGQWPRVLIKKDLDFMINSCFKNEFVK